MEHKTATFLLSLDPRARRKFRKKLVDNGRVRMCIGFSRVALALRLSGSYHHPEAGPSRHVPRPVEEIADISTSGNLAFPFREASIQLRLARWRFVASKILLGHSTSCVALQPHSLYIVRLPVVFPYCVIPHAILP
jgi:hypothetical protein